MSALHIRGTKLLPFLLLLAFSINLHAQQTYTTFTKEVNNFCVTGDGRAASIVTSAADFPGVLRAAKDLQADIERVSHVQPQLITTDSKKLVGDNIIIAGTIGKSHLIDELIRKKKLNVQEVKGKWETYVIETIENPFPKIKRALVIAGSDKRGTIFGMYDVSSEIGVSPWFWWADAPVEHHPDIYIKPGRYSDGEPKVKYRGIFINDEQPALGGWVRENYGGFNSKFYVKVFELILRLKGNFLWPAMWGQSFYSDDPLSPQLADEYGVVISTSHHEPMMRAHVEWQRNGGGPWNYNTNEEKLREFWREGIKRMGDNESIVTLAMRGDGDEPMSEDANVKLLQKIVADQRSILAETTGKDVTTIPQVWALYKEVQEYYDKGMRVPDDVTLLLCDDNWGNIRKLPKLDEKPRAGGYGIYYHFDYVGGPRNYKWINTNPLPRIWEQMHMAYEYGATRIWVVNVGDIKPMEFPISFFLDYAWNPEKWTQDDLDKYTIQWVKQQFGDYHTAAIAEILAQYAKYNSRRKPELLSPTTYSLVHYREAERIVSEYNQLAEKAERIYQQLPEQYKDAYYQLILYPVVASANLNEMKVTAGLNHLYAKQGRASTNELAEKVRKLFDKDKELTHYYHTEMADGKWNHMMSQTHISYTYWQQPEKDVVPEVREIQPAPEADMGIAVEGSDEALTKTDQTSQLPQFDAFSQQSYYIDVFNRGQATFDFSIMAKDPWIKVNADKGSVKKEQRLWVSLDWSKVPEGTTSSSLSITGTNKTIHINISAFNPASKNEIKGFVESNGYVSIEAVHFSNAVNTNQITWQKLPDHGRTLSAVTTFPVTANVPSPGGDSPRLEYDIHVFNEGEIKVMTYVSPTIDYHNTGGLRYAISIDGAEPQIINIHPDKSNRAWEKSVAENSIVSSSTHTVTPGHHTIKFWAVDASVVLQKIVVDTGGLKPSYLGPPESVFFTHK